MLCHRGIWNDARYQQRKESALQQDQRYKTFVWHKRGIMPICVIEKVRHWYPNNNEKPYLGHCWE